MRIVGSTLVSLLSVLAACSMSHDPAPPSGVDGGPPVACTPLFEPCESAGECCDGYCPVDTYGPIVCTARAPDGSFCVTHDECQSRRCVESVCGGSTPEPTCVPAGVGCSLFPGPGGFCCAGTRCLYDARGATVCLVPGEDGAPCAVPADCASGTCIGGHCGIPTAACLGDGAVCSIETAPCCGGLTCVEEIAYGPTAGYCRRALADGEACGSDLADACSSRRCIDGMCRAADCVGETMACEQQADCCGGFCDTSTYGPWFCRPPQPAGAYCESHTWCASRSCGATFTCD